VKNKVARPGRIKGALLNWLGFSFQDIENWRQFYGRETISGERVYADEPTKLATVYACTRLISQRISTLPLNLYRMTDEGRVVDRSHPLSRLLRLKPNSRMTAPLFWEAVFASMLLQRGAYIEPRRNAMRQLVSLEFRHPLRVSKQPDGDYIYLSADGKKNDIPRSRMVYIPAFTLDGECGKSVIEYGLEVIGNALAADRAAGSTFKKGLLPTTAFKYPTVLKDNQRNDARATIETLSGAMNAGKPVILEAGMDAMSIGINPNDAQLLESRQMSAEEVCSLFGVPPTMIGRGDKASSWASSAEHLNLWLLNYTLMPWMKRVEAAIWDGLLLPEEQDEYIAEFNAEGMLRGDSAARQAFYTSALQNGWLNRNEVRALENRPPFDGGDVYTVQANMIPVDRMGQQDESQRMRSALAAWLTEVKQ
jgi:HK97 family phage portal protein